MQKKLDSLQERQLAVRLEISRTISVFSTRDLAEGFDMSLSTLHRYTSPHAREISRESTRRQNLVNSISRKENKGRCYKCRKDLIDHPRCICEILLHAGAPNCGAQGCIDAITRATIHIHETV